MMHPPSFTTKAKIAFEFFDANKTAKGISVDDLGNGFRRLAFEFTQSTVNDLHAKGDANCDGLLSFAEWQRFGELYPTLLDCVYYRSIDAELERTRRSELENKGNELTALRKQEADSREIHVAAQQATAEAESLLTQQSDAIVAAQQHAAGMKAAHEQAKVATEQARSDLRQANSDLNIAKDRERQANSAASESKRLIESAERKLNIQCGKVNHAEEKVRELERQLAQARAEVEQEMCEADKVRTEIAKALERDNEIAMLAQEATRQLRAAMDTVTLGEEEVRARQANEKDTAGLLREANASVAKECAQKDVCMRNLAATRDIEKQRLHESQQASAAAENMEREIIHLEKEFLDSASKREETNMEENPLIEQELKLRAQRDNLEQKEAQLNNEVCHFNDRKQRSASPRRSASPLQLELSSRRVR
eukprot:TRINITY_DN16761_c0_g1_i1.p1 TRINITY_DN16761_c0_g1~~TRINITY_DN16761_c0_g1_i1.p1  ORF type:complete len:424 (+),score=106.12 TRINITY_DN16761_c0_g1_i1:61-1332(+)